MVGASGAGKTTLGRVLLGLTRPDEGFVIAGGRPLADADLDRWRSGGLSQHPALVPGTVAATWPSATRRRPGGDPEAARLAGADGFVRRLPAGYDTVVGAGGHGLSAGQRQRLGRAGPAAGRLPARPGRAHRPPGPGRHRPGRDHARDAARVETILLLTHDLDLASRADRVLRLQAGRAATLAGAGPAEAAGGRRVSVSAPASPAVAAPPPRRRRRGCCGGWSGCSTSSREGSRSRSAWGAGRGGRGGAGRTGRVPDLRRPGSRRSCR